MSHFFQLSSLALIWRKLEQVWQWGRNWVISRRLTKKSIDVQSSQFQPNYRRRFVLNLLVDLGILGLAFLFRDSAFLKGIENEGIDTLMQIRQKIIPANPDIPAFVSLDIDDKTHQAWNTPMFTPHDRLLNLIKTAVNAEASLVIIDVDLSRETSLKGLEKYTQGLRIILMIKPYLISWGVIKPPVYIKRFVQLLFWLGFFNQALNVPIALALAFWMRRLKSIHLMYNGLQHYFLVIFMNIMYGIGGYGNRLARTQNQRLFHRWNY